MSLELTPIEAKVYEIIKNQKKIDFKELLNILKESNIKKKSLEDNLRRALEILKYNSLISEKNLISKEYSLDKNGKKALKQGLIEEIFCDYIKDKGISISNLKNLEIPNLKSFEISLAFGLSKKHNLINIKNSKIKVKEDYKKKVAKKKKALKNIKDNKYKKTSDSILKSLIKRKDFIITKKKNIKKYKIKNIENYNIKKSKRLHLTSDLIKSDLKDIDLKEFNVEELPNPKMIGRIHPLRKVINYMKQIFLDMGFKEMKGPYVETCFWNMDSMFISQDHPARDQQDTFYLPLKGQLPKDENLISVIRKLHKDGAHTKSKGYKYDWSQDLAKKLVLRTHTTATTYRTFYNMKNKKNAKYFCIDKVFRNETTDSSHLPEFHQAEGFVIGENICFANLLDFIKTFLGKLGINKIKFKPNYNPYTEPSVEAFAYFPEKEKWIEVINAGVFRPEALAPYNIGKNVIAWGFGVERLAMLIYNKDIKELFGDECDLDWLRTYKIPSRKIK